MIAPLCLPHSGDSHRLYPNQLMYNPNFFQGSLLTRGCGPLMMWTFLKISERSTNAKQSASVCPVPLLAKWSLSLVAAGLSLQHSLSQISLTPTQAATNQRLLYRSYQVVLGRHRQQLNWACTRTSIPGGQLQNTSKHNPNAYTKNPPGGKKAE